MNSTLYYLINDFGHSGSSTKNKITHPISQVLATKAPTFAAIAAKNPNTLTPPFIHSKIHNLDNCYKGDEIFCM